MLRFGWVLVAVLPVNIERIWMGSSGLTREADIRGPNNPGEKRYPKLNNPTPLLPPLIKPLLLPPKTLLLLPPTQKSFLPWTCVFFSDMIENDFCFLQNIDTKYRVYYLVY